jgi:hypothetical protein
MSKVYLPVRILTLEIPCPEQPQPSAYFPMAIILMKISLKYWIAGGIAICILMAYMKPR